MKNFVAISSTLMSLILGIAIPVYAQQDQKRDKQDHPDREQPRSDQQRQSDDRQRQDQQQQQYQNRQNQAQQQQDQNRQQEQRIQRMQDQDRQQQQGQEQQRRQDQDRQQEERAREQQHQDRQQHDSRRQQYPQYSQDNRGNQQYRWEDRRARNWESDHRSWQQRGGYNGYRIPEDRYRGYFGPQHSFRISGLPFMVYGGNPRFQYRGYWITLLDPWPEYWSNNWYDNDDVYVNYEGDGYYMHNRRYPGVGIAIDITM